MKNSFVLIMIFALTGFLSSLSQAAQLQSSAYMQLANNSEDLDSAVETIKQKTEGRILSTKTVIINGSRVYKIKVLLPSGKVKTFSVSAQ